ncbi:MAG: RNA polymerase sigma factor [Clostridia bacterium]|nr:RNA polymerase sigma factor [Clostridia bacterium]
MDRETAAAFTQAQMQPVYGYCLRRCASVQDAEDTAQEILLRTLAALVQRDDIPDPTRYLWTIARNTLANHHRTRARCTVGVPPDAADDSDLPAALLAREEICQLHEGVARLGRQQRQIVSLHYFHGLRIAEIARELGIPAGTVKWHLHEARKELKQTMTHPHDAARLKFDPIRFSGFHTEGSIGPEGSPWRAFRGTLAQNIAYACWREARSAAEIADSLGVSPAYVEDEAARLASQGYLCEEHGRYRCAILLTEWTPELIRLSDALHTRAAALLAPALAQAVTPDMLREDRIGIPAGHGRAYALWALVPWMIASQGGGSVTFQQAATLRPDGGQNLCCAAIIPPGTKEPALAQGMERFSGPCWNECEGLTLWQIDTIWSEERIGEIMHATEVRIISLLRRLFIRHERLNEEETAVLVRRGVMRSFRDEQGRCCATLLPVWVKGQAVQQQLLDAARSVYAAHRDVLQALLEPYASALMADTPPHLRLLREYTLQTVFSADRFILHCLHQLVQDGVLPLPTPEERRSLHALILTP